MSPSLYLDASAVLRAILENGTSPEIEARIAAAPALVTSRLSLVESARALHRLRQLGQLCSRPSIIALRSSRALSTGIEPGRVTLKLISRRELRV
jgi:predicted nucleic acid-binding protein